MSPIDKSRFVARLKELRRLGYSPEYAMRRATQEDAEAHGESLRVKPQARAAENSPAVATSQKREELFYEMNRLADGRDAGAVLGVPGVFRKDGLTPERMVDKLRQDPKYDHIRNVDDLVDLLHTAIFGTTNMEAQGIPLSATQLREQLGIDLSTTWWKDSWRERGSNSKYVRHFPGNSSQYGARWPLRSAVRSGDKIDKPAPHDEELFQRHLRNGKWHQLVINLPLTPKFRILDPWIASEFNAYYAELSNRQPRDLLWAELEIGAQYVMFEEEQGDKLVVNHNVPELTGDVRRWRHFFGAMATYRHPSPYPKKVNIAFTKEVVAAFDEFFLWINADHFTRELSKLDKENR